ncbi:MAG: ABC transporter ATP-binding protein [Planctomycetota bacterium]|jgi:ABC-2 type transport system ATP-binding protein|nr:ABC transporter ATP-binding protein [Planctomycetota bacterium]MEC7429143.1 ABC transporter ATP-binding protein [Planctomycetota bacterium]MEC7446217.1 ABC transporter ATP-binding protein [Planctomycetota bacterium]MEC7447889.1 ABC transporter ATP-binding protein [Planctomycetota bacterium]MEC7497161.1 ABC transporter ATP-binding protein [Planctomycetota bacterium]
MIKTVNLTKKYGELHAIQGIELDLDEGDLFGFIGPNGAGKTTTMRIIATLLEPTWGEAYVCGNSIYNNAQEIRRLVGYMPDFFGVYDDMKVIEYLEFFAAAYRIRGEARRKRCDEMLEVVDLDFKRDAFANTLSRGQTQRLGLARVLLHDPQVLLLDEPLSGLDPRARIEMRNLLRRLGQTGKTIVVSSHILPELADICNKIGIIDRGVMNVNSEVTEVIKQVRSKTVLHINVAENLDAAAKLLDDSEIVEDVSQGDGHLVVSLKDAAEDYSTLPTQLIESGFKLTLFREEDVNLESAFMALTRGVGAKI